MRLLPHNDGGNVWTWGPLYYSRARIQYTFEPYRAQPLFSPGWINEVEHPWRSGRGYAVRLANSLHSFGLWVKREPPQDIRDKVISAESEV